MTSSRAKIFFTVRLRLQIRCDIRTKTAGFFCVKSRLQRCVVTIVQDEILSQSFSFSVAAARSLLPLSVCGCCAKFLVRKQLHDTRNRPTDATVHIDSWVVASYRPYNNRNTAPNQL